MNTLDIDKNPEDTLVAIAMSGGVDSSTTAALLQKEGYKIIGITLKLFEGLKAEQVIEDAREVCAQLKCEHHVLDCVEKFKHLVIDDFVDSYSKGRTPLPCAQCNKHIKFGEMVDFAKELGADCLATGHYVQKTINEDTKKTELHRAIDLKKDQSYFLFALNQEQIDFARFPLGNQTKDQTREEAALLGLKSVSKKPDSQDICFVLDKSYVDVVADHNPDALTPGDIVHTDGRVLGKHNGIVNYTIGQRKGLGIGGGVTVNNEPLFVIELNADDNTVIVGAFSDLAKNKIIIDETNWLEEIPEEGLRADVKIRSIQKAQPATIFEDHVILDEAAFGIANGQACVAYIGDRVIGGGWIIGADKV